MKPTIIALAVSVLAFAVQGAGSPLAAALKQGDFATALKLFPAEIEKRPDDANLKKSYAALRTTLRRQELFDREEDPELLQNLGKPLRAYYYRFGLYAKAAAVDRKIYGKAPTSQNAVAYAVTLLNLDQNPDAVKIFDSLKLEELPAGAQLCAALAYARTGDAAKADAIRAKFPSAELKPGVLPLAARIAAVRNDAETAAALTRRILENAPEKQHDMLKKQLFGSADFAGIAANADFQAALKTASKLSDECATCPNRGTGKCDHANDPNHKCDHDHK